LTFRRRVQSARQRGIAAGYRSGFEEDIASDLERRGLPFDFEKVKIDYIVPARYSKYTPDFKVIKPNGHFFIETKGLWCTADRQKHLLLKRQHPLLDIRLLFQNASTKLYKGSKTTYADYATKHGFAWAHKHIPDEWVEEMLMGLKYQKSLNK
tara:strand:- start:244 stop:702 length:459 start_codon:yes stop_codon:yes gene_type:complete